MWLPVMINVMTSLLGLNNFKVKYLMFYAMYLLATEFLMLTLVSGIYQFENNVYIWVKQQGVLMVDCSQVNSNVS